MVIVIIYFLLSNLNQKSLTEKKHQIRGSTLCFNNRILKLFRPNESLIVSGTRKVCLRSDNNNEGRKEDMELPIFDLTAIANATDNFSSTNKLGEGGFGSVYKVNNNLAS
jgi:hypothetical protein